MTLTWTRAGRSISITHDDQSRPADNLRVLYLAAEAMRLNEARGIGDVLASAYAQLPAPAENDPWRALGLRPGAGRDAAESMFRTLAKISHPDGTQPDPVRFTEITAAIDRIRMENQ